MQLVFVLLLHNKTGRGHLAQDESTYRYNNLLIGDFQ